ncbi:TIGR02266 family protein [Myxococcota bacterium]|nr:TIGR02266 family protein [Myxococcota bacterium]MBU1382964.1 TIGR02266 family protein [Myxococcota bacterium]MBU1498656.1 TIGR02266 family protein [Myxococcota bacterium]
MPTPIKLTIKFKADTIAEFVEKYGTYVSQGGIFVRTRKPLAVGTLLDFEFKLQNGDNLLKGLGTVVWTREHDPARKTAPAGMGLRYDSLDPESQVILEKILVLKSKDSVIDEKPEEEHHDMATSPGNQEEKTRVASIDVLNKLRGSDTQEKSDDSPGKDLFEETSDLPKRDAIESAPTQTSEAPQKSAEPEESKPQVKPDPKPESLTKPASKITSEKPAIEKPEWDEPTPIPSKIHPLIPEAEETNVNDGIPVKAETEKTADEKIDDVPDLDEDVSNALDSLAKKASDDLKEKEEEEEKSGEKAEPVKVPEKIAKEDKKEKKPEIVAAKPVVSEIVEEEKGGAGRVVVIILLLAILGGLSFYYYKFIYSARKGTDQKTVIDKKKVVKTPPAMQVDMKIIEMKPEMKPEDMKEPDPKLVMKPTVDSTPVVMAVDMKAVDATKLVEMQPDMVEPPKNAPDLKCDAEKEVVAKFTTVPDGVEIKLNDEKTGKKTPASICLSKTKSYSVKLEHDDFITTAMYFPVVKADITEHKQLVPLPRQIVIQTRPKRAIVIIDGKKMGPSTIAQKYAVPQDIWKIEVQKAGYQPWTLTIKKDDPKWVNKGYAKIYSVLAILKKE